MSIEKSYKELEKELQLEYKKKLNELRKVKTEKEAVGQVFTKGILPLYIYYILSLGPTNGNDITTQISSHTNGKWTPSTGGVYPLLKKMEKQGYITYTISKEGRVQKIYSLTQKGLIEFENKKDLLKDKIFDALDVFKLISKEVYGEKEDN